MKSLRVLTICTLAFLALAGAAGYPRGGVSLDIISTWAKRSQPFIIHTESGDISTNDVLISCTAVMDNQTGSSLTATSAFFSVFDGLCIVGFDASGKQIARQSYVHHQSPYSFGQQFTLPMGRTTNELRFPVRGIPETNKILRVRLDGVLPGSTYGTSMTSDVVNVTIGKWRTQ